MTNGQDISKKQGRMTFSIIFQDSKMRTFERIWYWYRYSQLCKYNKRKSSKTDQCIHGNLVYD